MEFLPQLVKDLSEVTSAQAKQFSELLIDACLISAVALEGTGCHFVTDLVEQLLLEHLQLALVLDLLLFSHLLGTEDLLLVLVDFHLQVSDLLSLLLSFHLKALILTLRQLEIILDHFEVRF